MMVPNLLSFFDGGVMVVGGIESGGGICLDVQRWCRSGNVGCRDQ